MALDKYESAKKIRAALKVKIATFRSERRDFMAYRKLAALFKALGEPNREAIDGLPHIFL